jgi:N-acetyl-anhydromuramyl-L-alanine amidase AmpD
LSSREVPREIPHSIAKLLKAEQGGPRVTLPTLKWRPSPNFSSRLGAAVDLVVLHDCQGSYLGSIATFLGNNYGNPVSAHFVLKDDGSEVTQMVDLADKAWHAVDLNRRSVGLEMAGYAERGYSDAELDNAAKIMAYLCHTLSIPARHARGGSGSGIESHYGLGKAGGGHTDPSVDPTFMDKFVARVHTHMNDSAPEGWARNRLKPSPSPAPSPTPAPAPAYDLSTIGGVQAALRALGYTVIVDGVDGPLTERAVKAFQAYEGLVVDGVAGPMTQAALLRELRKLAHA